MTKICSTCNDKIPTKIVKKIGLKWYCSNKCFENGKFKSKTEVMQLKKYGRILTKEEMYSSWLINLNKGLVRNTKKGK